MILTRHRSDTAVVLRRVKWYGGQETGRCLWMCSPSMSSGAFSRRFLPAVMPAMDGSRLVRFLVAFFLTDAPSCTSGLWLRATSRKDGPGSDSSPQAVPTRGQGRPATGDHDGEGRG